MNPSNIFSVETLPVTIQKKLVYQLYYQTRISLTTLLILTGMLFFFLKDSVPDPLLYSWFVLTASLNANRLFDTYRFLHTPHDSDFRRWKKRFALKSSVNAFLWGMSALLFLPYLHDQHLSLIIFVFIMGIAGGAVSAIAFNMRIAALYLFFLLMPLAVYLLIYVHPLGLFLGTMMVMYYLLLLNVCRNTAEAIINSYQQEEKYRQSQEELTLRQEKLNNLFTQAPVSIFYFDKALNILDTNHAFAELFHLNKDELVGMNLYNIPDKRIIPHLEKVINDGKIQHHSGPYHSIKGLNLWLEAKSTPIRDARNNIIGGMTLIENKTREKEALDELHFLANHDPLTTLPNRRNLTRYMHRLIKNVRHETEYSLLFYLDLNRFKQINDSLGHSIGDTMLKQVAQRLGTLTSEQDMLCRLGGDEFIIILPFVAPSREESIRHAEAFSDKIQRRFDEPFTIEEMHLKVDSSIGVVPIEPGSKNIEEIIRYADISMYQAKRKQRERISFYNAELDEERRARFALQHELAHAVEHDQLELYYQPIVKIENDRVRAAEALLRWNHPTQGQLPPDTFLPIAEEAGMIDAIGWWVIEAACRQIAGWKAAEEYRLKYISINLDAAQLLTYTFEERFFTILARHGVSPSEIKIELTETSLIDSFEQTKATIDRLQARGIRCAIDDFGTGYSSLSYLQRLNFSVLKIDRAFICEMPENDKVLFLVKSIIDIGKRLDYRIVVEGIETQEQKEMIATINGEVSYQGFLFSPPVDADTFKRKFLTSTG